MRKFAMETERMDMTQEMMGESLDEVMEEDGDEEMPGAIDPDAVNTDGVLSFKGFTLWGAWNMGGTNTMQVVSVGKEITKNVVEKVSGYSWCSAVGSEATRFGKGIRRYEVHVRRKSGPLQVGIMAVPSSGQNALPSNWNDPSFVDSAWYVSETGEIRNGNRCLLRTHKPINEGDVIGIEIDMDHGIVVFRKIPLSLKGQHLFGAPCPVCGTDECREWNREETSPRPGASATQAQPCLYGFMGVSREVMCYKNRVTLGNLPVGTVDADGVWMHANKQRMTSAGEAMARESIKISEYWDEQLRSMPYLSQ